MIAHIVRDLVRLLQRLGCPHAARRMPPMVETLERDARAELDATPDRRADVAQRT